MQTHTQCRSCGDPIEGTPLLFGKEPRCEHCYDYLESVRAALPPSRSLWTMKLSPRDGEIERARRHLAIALEILDRVART